MLIRRLLFYRHFHKNRFAQALACRGAGAQPNDDLSLWACYRLGLYPSVVAAKFTGKRWRGLFARAVSLAACGHLEEARTLAWQFADRQVAPDRLAELADALAPFDAKLALALLQRCANKPLSLQAALLCANDLHQDAADLLQPVMQQTEISPELYLYFSNTQLAQSPADRLQLLNQYLGRYGLSPVSLLDASLPPSPTNLVSSVALPAVDGPKVSILMTAFCSGARIETAIRSLLAQTWRNIELIVVDDASDDDTATIVQALAAIDSRVIYLPLPSNVGTYVAKTVGLSRCSGEFVICHDSDDWSHPCKIALQVQPLLADPELIFTTAQWVRMQDDGVYYARPVHPLMRLNPASPMFRRQIVLEKAGSWDWVRTGADSEFLNRLKLVFGRQAMKRVVMPLTFGAHRPDSLMTADATGHGQGGMSETRLAYWESWGRWHIAELHFGRKPRLPIAYQAERLFQAPKKIIVSQLAVAQCLNDLDLNAASLI